MCVCESVFVYVRGCEYVLVCESVFLCECMCEMYNMFSIHNKLEMYVCESVFVCVCMYVYV